ncbi:AAA+ superfamily predicted ATPase [Nitrobacteraceae bacterium AZCC 2161]
MQSGRRRAEPTLGHLLRAMRQDFDAARAQAPCVMFIDEIDSFPDRAGVQHAHRDYVVEVVNGLLEQIDGIAGREGVIVIGASNKAPLRSGAAAGRTQPDRQDRPAIQAI